MPPDTRGTPSGRALATRPGCGEILPIRTLWGPLPEATLALLSLCRVWLEYRLSETPVNGRREEPTCEGGRSAGEPGNQPLAVSTTGKAWVSGLSSAGLRYSLSPRVIGLWCNLSKERELAKGPLETGSKSPVEVGTTEGSQMPRHRLIRVTKSQPQRVG